MYKNKYLNENVILLMNYNNIIEDDFQLLTNANVFTANILDMNIIKEYDFLHEMFLNSICPIYINVDMLKILIQYEYMTNPIYDYDYIVFSDLDIQDKDNINVNDIQCTPYRSDFINEYYNFKIFDEITLELLDVFGYIMNGRYVQQEDFYQISTEEYNELSSNSKKKLDEFDY